MTACYDRKILNALLDKYERSAVYRGTTKRNQHIRFRFNHKSVPDYFGVTAYNTRPIIEAQCGALSKKGWVCIEKDEGDIQAVVLCLDAIPAIYAFLGRRDPTDAAQRACKILGAYTNTDGAAGAFAADMIRALSEKRSVAAYFDVGDPDEIKDIMEAAAAMQGCGEEQLKRNFSMQVFHDSKRFEAIEKKVLKIFQNYGDGADLEDEALLQAYNILKNPGFIYIKGKGRFRLNRQTIDLEALGTEFSISGSHLNALKILELPIRRIITIENLTSFYNFYAEDALVVYLAGYPNRIRRTFLMQIADFKADLEFYHFGDLDAGGFGIYKDLCEKTDIAFQTLGMDVETYMSHINYGTTLTGNDRKRLSRLMESLPAQRDVIALMLEHGVKIEQECITIENDKHLSNKLVK